MQTRRIMTTLALVTIGWFAALTSASAQGLQPAATLSYLLGDVEVARGGTTGWQGARVNQALFAGDRIRTGADGQAELIFGGASRLRLAERTDLLIPDRVENQNGLLQRVSVFLGSIWANVRRLARNETFEVEGGHSIGGVKGTRFQLDRRQAMDRWRLASGRLAIRRKGSNQAVELTDGQEVTVDLVKLGSVEATPAEELDRSYLDFNRSGARRWQSVVTKLLAAERRLVQRALRDGPDMMAEAERKSREIGDALRDAERQIRAFVEQRSQDPADQKHGTGDLLGFMDRAMQNYQRLHEQLTGRSQDGRPIERGSLREEEADQRALRVIRAADAFLGRYLQALQRSLRLVKLHLQGVKKLKPPEVHEIHRRLVEGYRQSETSFFRARDAVRFGAPGARSPVIERAFQQVTQKWQRIGRDFRIAREIMKKVMENLHQPPTQDPTGGGRQLPGATAGITGRSPGGLTDTPQGTGQGTSPGTDQGAAAGPGR